MSAVCNRVDVTILFFPFREKITALYRLIYFSINFINGVGVFVTASVVLKERIWRRKPDR